MSFHTWKQYVLHFLLFLITLLTTTVAGSEWIHGRFFFLNEESIGWSQWMTWDKWKQGLNFSMPFLAFLTVHEFGHYLAARRYKVDVSLPYFIPLWTGITSTIGTAGAFIRLKGVLRSRQEFFDIGIAGPLAGFVVSVGVLAYGFTHLPSLDYIFTIHPEYKKYGVDYALHVYKNTEGNAIALGKNLIFIWFEHWLVTDKSLIPNTYEIIHYPYLFAGYLSLLFTALNLIPIGQLDGGHILYGLIGAKWHRFVSPVLFVLFVFYAGLGLFNPYQLHYDISSMHNTATALLLIFPYLFYLTLLYVLFSRTVAGNANVWLLTMGVFTAQMLLTFFVPTAQGYTGWFVFAFILGRFLGIYHPPAQYDTPLDWKRKILGWLALGIFLICFSPQPFLLK